MPIYLQDIHVKNLGPLVRFSFEFGTFNLIYGRNERGKTFLTEFIVRSLFRNPKRWGLRQALGDGVVRVVGVGDDPEAFSPESDRKLEDFLEESFDGLPADFSRLLVVKGAEVELAARSDGGVDKAILKRFLSGQQILDRIAGEISKTIQGARLESAGNIVGDRRGEIRDREALLDRLKHLDHLFEEIDTKYSGGGRKILEERQERLYEQKQRLVHAKHHYAYTLSQEIDRLKRAVAKLNAERLQALYTDISTYEVKKAEYRRKKEEQKAAMSRSQHYTWLDEAGKVYQRLVEEPRSLRVQPLLLAAAVVLLMLSGVFVLLDRPTLALGGLAATAVVSGLTFVQLRRQATKAGQREELQQLQNEYRERMDEALTGLPQILQRLEEQQQDFNTSKYLRETVLPELSGDLQTLESRIVSQFKELTGEALEPEDWAEARRRLQHQLNRLQEELAKRREQLAGLRVDPSDYREEDPGVEYSKHDEEETEARLIEIQQEIDDEIQGLQHLKQRICDVTGDPISLDWEVLIQHLRNVRRKTLDAYREKTAEILGKMAVFQVIQELRKAEDAKIAEGLRSPQVQKPLLQMTHRYKELRLEKERLLVADDFSRFELNQLSTGAQQQVVLALRIGFSTRLLREDRLFLLLDDAFQYSDWQRRAWLLDLFVELARNGWQIVYLTMDDHIRDLFMEKGKAFGEAFRYAELKTE